MAQTYKHKGHAVKKFKELELTCQPFICNFLSEIMGCFSHETFLIVTAFISDSRCPIRNHQW